jgi:predicted nuclease of predicted toxin-antitoxin system
VQKVSANPTQYVGMAINSFVFQVDVCVKLLAERPDASLIASAVANTLMINIADDDFATSGAWLCIVRDSGTQEALQLDEEINDAYIHENFFVDMKEDETT